MASSPADPSGSYSELQFDHFTVRDVIGRGAMGVVLEALDEKLGRRVALKVLHTQDARPLAQRLIREARALARISHPNVVQVHEVGLVDGRVFIAMELVRGLTLRQWCEHGEPSWRQCVQVYLQAGRGLVAAHAEGIVHRDFKPSNCIIDREGRVRVLDFGLARCVEAPSSSRQPDGADGGETPSGDGHEDDDGLDDSLTNEGAIVGTLAYMPPEQLIGHTADDKSDQFSFCVALYEALYRERPFADSGVEQKLARLRSGEVRAPREGARVPVPVRRILLRGLAFDRAKRWPSMTALLDELLRASRPRWRRWMGVAFIGGAIALLGGGVWYQALVGRLCEGAERQLIGVWDQARSGDVHSAILGTGLEYAPQTWLRVKQRLDAYAAGWVTAHTAACEATSVRKAQSEELMDLRMACLATRRSALEEAVEVLAEADEVTVERSVTMLANLPPLRRCEDVEALQSRVPPPDDADTAQRVSQAREQLAMSRVHHDAGQAARSLDEVQAVVEEAQSLEYRPLLAEAKEFRGSVRGALGQLDDAEQDLEDAFSMATASGDFEVATLAATALIYNVGYLQSRHDEALIWSTTALALSQWPGASAYTRGRALHNTAILHSQRGDAELALDHERDAMAVIRGSSLPQHPDMAACFNTIGAQYKNQRNYGLALTFYRRSLAIREDLLGPRHPLVASTLNNIGVVLQVQGEFDQAVQAYRRAETIYEQGQGAPRVNWGHTLNNLGNYYNEQASHETALHYFRRALSIYEQTSGPQSAHVAQTQTNIGLLLSAQGADELAIEHLERAISIFDLALDPLHPNIAYASAALGSVLLGEGDVEQATSKFQRAREIFEKKFGPEHPLLADIFVSLGRAAEARGELDGASSYYGDAVALYERTSGPLDPSLVEPLVGMADVERQRGHWESARAHAERALALAEGGGVTPDILAATSFALARVLWADRRERAGARLLAERARDAYDVHGPASEDERRRVEAWLAEHAVGEVRGN